jgi:hypothetical protein
VFDDASEAESLQYRTWLKNFETDNPPNKMSPDSLQSFRNIVESIHQNFAFISAREYFEESSMSKLSERNERCQARRSGPHVVERTRTSQASVSASASIAMPPPTMAWNRSFGNKGARCGAKNGRPTQTDDLRLETELELCTPPQRSLASGKRSFPSCHGPAPEHGTRYRKGPLHHWRRGARRGLRGPGSRDPTHVAATGATAWRCQDRRLHRSR